jgi:TonB family protein
MKRKFLVIFSIIILVVISQELVSQDIKTIYFNDQWEQCNKEQSSYYREYYKTESKEYYVQDFYKSGQVKMVGTFKKRNWKEKNGHFTYYHENGQKKSEGEYIDDKLAGKWVYWYENGSKASESEYIDDKRTGKWISWHANGNIKTETEFENGESICLTKEFDEQGHFLFEYVEDLKTLDNYSDYELSMSSWLDFLAENIHYPDRAKQLGQQGRVFTSFFIDSNGNVYDIKILRGVSVDIDSEALRVLKLYKWPKPRYKGKETIVKFYAPLKFSLN